MGRRRRFASARNIRSSDERKVRRRTKFWEEETFLLLLVGKDLIVYLEKIRIEVIFLSNPVQTNKN